MKLEHLEERVNDYQSSIETVVDKRVLWNTKIKDLIQRTPEIDSMMINRYMTKIILYRWCEPPRYYPVF